MDVNLEIAPDIIVEEDVSTMLQTFHFTEGGEKVDGNDVLQWFECDRDLPVFKRLTPHEIVAKVTNPISPSEDDKVELPLPVKNKMSHSDALSCVEKLLDYYGCDDEASFTDIAFLKKLQTNLRKREAKSDEVKKQQSMTQYFTRN